MRDVLYSPAMAKLQITPEMIEAAAQAIRNEIGGRSTFRLRLWNALPPTLRDEYRAEAFAALSAGFAVLARSPAIS